MSRPVCKIRAVRRTRTRRTVALVGLAVAMSGVAPLLAQQARGVEGDPLLLPDIVVTATQVPISRLRLPSPVTILSGARIRELGIRTVAEALKLVPGLAVVSSGSAGSQISVFIRGGESDYVKVLVDGAPLNEAGGAIDLADLSTDQIERIEVVRGPASVVYGSDAVSGVIQIFTRHGRGTPQLEVTALGGVGERRLGDGTHGVMETEATLSGSGEALSYTVGGGRSWSGGTYPLNNENALNTAGLRLAWAGGGSTSLGLTSRFSDGAFHYPTDGAGNADDTNQVTNRRSWTTSLTAGRQLTNRVELAFQASTTARDQDSQDEQDDPTDTSGFFASRYQSKVGRNSADLQLTTLLERGTITVGGSHERATGDLKYHSNSEFEADSAKATFERSNTAVYVEVLAEPNARTQATLGFRTDRNETFGNFNTYRVGLSWNVLERTRVRSAMGRAFREPTFGENFGSGFGYDIGNDNLVPERTRSWELGLEHTVGPVLVSSTWFDQRFEDLIQFTFATSGPTEPNYVNVGGAKSSGLELSAEGTLGVVFVDGSYTYLDTEVLDPGLATDATFVQGEPLLRRPKHSGSITGQFVHARGTVGAVLKLVGEREDVDYAAGFPAPRVTLPGYRTLDLSADYRLPALRGAATQLRLKIENLLDTDYEGIAGFPAPGRLIRIGATIRVGG